MDLFFPSRLLLLTKIVPRTNPLKLLTMWVKLFEMQKEIRARIFAHCLPPCSKTQAWEDVTLSSSSPLLLTRTEKLVAVKTYDNNITINKLNFKNCLPYMSCREG